MDAMTIVDPGASVCVDFSAPTVQIVRCVEMEMVSTKSVSTKSGEDHSREQGGKLTAFMLYAE